MSRDSRFLKFLYNYIGIVIEFATGIYLVINSYRTKVKMADLPVDMDSLGNTIESIKAEIVSSFRTQTICLGIFLLGVGIQFYIYFQRRRNN